MENFMKYFECPICLDRADEPMECTSCNNIFCKKCVDYLRKSIIDDCPVCKAEADFKHSPFAKRLLKSIPVQCKLGCGLIDKESIIKIHERICPNKIFECFRCKKKKPRQDFLNHIIEDHSQEALEFFTENTKRLVDVGDENKLFNRSLDKNIKNKRENNKSVSPDVNNPSSVFTPPCSNRFYSIYETKK